MTFVIPRHIEQRIDQSEHAVVFDFATDGAQVRHRVELLP
jgi:hypothetical protein